MALHSLSLPPPVRDRTWRDASDYKSIIAVSCLTMYTKTNSGSGRAVFARRRKAAHDRIIFVHVQLHRNVFMDPYSVHACCASTFQCSRVPTTTF